MDDGTRKTQAETWSAALLQPVDEQAQYVVHLPIFEGPLDLLLHLIEKRQMEVTMVSLVTVTDQYIAYLRQWQQESPPLASLASFISVAARLLFIKSQSLLPQSPKLQEPHDGESAETMAEELQRHLLEYKFAKEVTVFLRQREETGLQTYGRSNLLAGIEAQLNWTAPTLTGLHVRALEQAFQRLLDLRAREDTQGNALLPGARVRVSECVATIRSYLNDRPHVLLEDILYQEQSRFVIVVTFIAVLELWKWERINVTQEDALGSILLERGARWNNEEWIEIIDE
ncbi:MAG TPA: ScpA family protein [Dictyobacter sp.]|jgi:segregation and condensation protein A|nr:ScpA family protein [Dictyobacter sp.]